MRPGPDVDVVMTKTLVKEPFVMALPDSHPLAARATVSLKACAAERFILYAPHLAPDFHSMIIRMCATAGFVPQLALEVGQVYTALGLVSSGAGFAFVPASVQRVHFDHVAYRPLRDPGPKGEIMLGWNRRNPSPLLESFVETARSVVAAIRHP
jgi:DNA-binding transcriptional LysR family regulator